MNMCLSHRRQFLLVAGESAFFLLSMITDGNALAETSRDGLVTLARFADSPDEPVSSSQFSMIHQTIRPQPQESLWTQVPWMTSLEKARKRAADEGKPLFVWVISDGHPCGLC